VSPSDVFVSGIDSRQGPRDAIRNRRILSIAALIHAHSFESHYWGECS
jgi:hypothetical protein